jgi:hypothetical protein
VFVELAAVCWHCKCLQLTLLSSYCDRLEVHVKLSECVTLLHKLLCLCFGMNVYVVVNGCFMMMMMMIVLVCEPLDDFLR